MCLKYFKRKKEMKLKSDFRRFIRDVDRNINQLTKDITEHVKLAAEAKQCGFNEQYRKAINAISLNMNTRLKYKSLKIDLKMAMQLRNTISIIESFANAMNRWGKSIKSTSKNFDINKTLGTLEDASDIIEEKNAELEELTTSITNEFSNINNNDSGNIIDVGAAEKIVDGYIANEGDSKSTEGNASERIKKLLDKDF